MFLKYADEILSYNKLLKFYTVSKISRNYKYL